MFLVCLDIVVEGLKQELEGFLITNKYTVMCLPKRKQPSSWKSVFIYTNIVYVTIKWPNI